jgi:ribosome-associated heat shock protein Hsp15
MPGERGKRVLAELRLDKWLWAARFYKTRSAATKAVSGGKVQLGGQRVKPARQVRVGDELRIHRGLFEYLVTVVSINDERRSAPEARLMYAESEQSAAQREQLRARLAAEGAGRAETRAAGRPSKKQRRQIARFTRGDE